MIELTQRQREILEFLQSHQTQQGFWPSIREIQARFGFKSTNAVFGHLKALQAKGAIARAPGQARAFRPVPSVVPLPDEAEAVADLPVYGSIAAGYPDGVEAGDAVGTLQVDVATVSRSSEPRRTFALKVRGESMVDAGINDGDTVVVDPRSPRDGDIVVALIDGQTTLKRFVRPAQGRPFLRSENRAFPAMHPISELVVQGVATALVRRL